jgi:hypothetical protein
MVMTAIVAVRTLEGYIFAADGRQTHGTSFDDDTVKVFHSFCRNSEVAWGCFNAVYHSFDGVDSFDLVKTSLVVSKHLVDRDFLSLADYAMEMARAIHHVLEVYYSKYSATICFPEEVFPGLAFVGYVNGEAQLAQVEIRHSGGKWLPPCLVTLPVRPCGLAIATGSETVYRALDKAGMLIAPRSMSGIDSGH